MKSFFGKGSGSEFGKIVAMDRFESGRSLSPLRQAEAYWTALLNGAGVPMRSQIDPRGLENILEYTFILERIAPGLARFRLAGSHLNALAGMEVRGMPLSAMFEASARDTSKSILDQVFGAPAVAEVGMISKGALGRTCVEARMILLPLQSDLGDVSRILGVLVSDGVIGSTPRRFDITSETLRPVADVRSARPPAQAEIAGFAEDQNPMNETGKRPGSHLRLVVSRED